MEPDQQVVFDMTRLLRLRERQFVDARLEANGTEIEKLRRDIVDFNLRLCDALERIAASASGPSTGV
jgi:hypothetical protein